MYEPEVDDYVIWDKGEYGIDEGWVYFKGDKEEPKKGFRDNPRYITIEVSVKPKPKCSIAKNDPHKYIHTLLLCYEHDWSKLQFVKKRGSKVIEHYSQYDDRAGYEEDRLAKMYKSQEGRPLDIQ